MITNSPPVRKAAAPHGRSGMLALKGPLGAVSHAWVACSLACALPLAAQTPNALTAEEEAAGWKLLFDGESNAGWVRPNGSPGAFIVEEASLRNAGGDICTQDDYQDFEFAFEYKYAANANSGVFLRTRRGVDPPYYSGVEISIQDNGSAGNNNNIGDAAVYGMKAAGVDMWTGPDKWNTMRIRLAGTRLENWHNGEKVIDLDMASEEWDTLYAQSKFTGPSWSLWNKETKGQICLQDHGSSYRVWFRTIRVLSIAPGSATPAMTPAPGFRWELQGSGPHRILAVEAPDNRGRDLEISIVDMHGKEARAFRAHGSRASIPLGNLPPGIYWLRAKSPGFAADRRFALF
jgi:hypothetical protein